MVRAGIVALIASLVGCHPRTSTTRDVEPAMEADAAPERPAGPRASSPKSFVLDAGPMATPSAENATTEGTIGLLVEHVLIDVGQTPASPYGYDLLVLTTLPGQKAARGQPFCPPLKRDVYEVCRRFRSCSVSDAGTSVVCDGASFELVQHDGATFLRGEGKELCVSSFAPAVTRPKTRERRAYDDL